MNLFKFAADGSVRDYIYVLAVDESHAYKYLRQSERTCGGVKYTLLGELASEEVERGSVFVDPVGDDPPYEV